MEEKKIIEEKLIMRLFIKAYVDFPKGKIIKSESPDFVLRTGPKFNTGIELTRLHSNNSLNDENGEELKKENLLINEIRKGFEGLSKLKIYIKFFFNGALWDMGDIPMYSGFVSLYLIKLLEGYENNKAQFFKLEEHLPEIFESIYFVVDPHFKNSCWDIGRPFLVYDLNRQLIENSIRNKEEKLTLYRKKRFDAYWLILATMKINPVKNFNVFNKLENWTFPSTFHKVFLFDVFENKAFELKK
jgi:hypothetical protein